MFFYSSFFGHFIFEHVMPLDASFIQRFFLQTMAKIALLLEGIPLTRLMSVVAFLLGFC